jgi:nucleotide-binding universal stress UspA family protein
VVDEGTARQVADSAAARAREAHPDVRSEAMVKAGRPPAVLLRLALGAGLLVLGHRGLGDGSSLVFGSVPRTALQALPCPVALVGLSGSPEGQAPGSTVHLADVAPL